MLFNQLTNLLNECIKARAFFINDRRAFNQCHECAVGVFDAHSGGAFASFHDDFDLTIFLLLRLQNAAERSHAVNLIGVWLINRRVVLRGQEDRPVGCQRLLESAD